MKKFLTLVSAAALSVSAMTSSVVYAESSDFNSPEYYSMIREQLEKNLDEYMEENNCEKGAHGLSWLRSLVPVSREIYESYGLRYAIDYEKDKDYPEMWTVNVNPAYIGIKLNFCDGITQDDVNKYLKDNYSDFFVYLGAITIRNSGKNEIVAADYKKIVNELIENKLIKSAELKLGDLQLRSKPPTYLDEPISQFKSTEEYYNTTDYSIVPEKVDTSTNQTVIDYYASGVVDCNFSVLMEVDKIPDGIEYELAVDTKYAKFSLTPEEAAKLDAETVKEINCFYAVPKENTFKNQTELLVQFDEAVKICGFQEMFYDKATSLDVDDVGFDITNAVNGDANCDEKFSIADATAILQHLGNPDEYGLSLKGMYNADCGGVMDGVTAADAVFIQSKLAKG